jgi:hypothetical protein
VPALERDDREAVARDEDQLEERALEAVIVDDDVRVAERNRRIARAPCLYLTIIDGPAHEQRLGGGIGAIAPGATIWEDRATARFNIDIGHRHGANS